MGRKLTIPYYRPTFVEKTMAEVGAGTEWPMECTLDQVAEIFYRVKRAAFTAGSAHMEEESTLDFYAPTTSQPKLAYASADSTNRIKRGYTTIASNPPAEVSVHNDQFLDAEYDRGDSEMWRDIGSDELGMWLQGEALATLPLWNVGSFITTAFTFDSELQSVTDPGSASDTDFFQLDQDGTFFSCAGFVRISGVAVVKSGPDEPLISGANRYFLGVYLLVQGGDYPNNFYIHTLNQGHIDPWTGQPPTICCNYVIRLSSGDVSCPIYGIAENLSPYGDTSLFSGTDFIHEATEWWPYAKDNGDPVWDAATGAKL